MARRPDMVEKAETIIDQFLHEWQKRPRFWYTEADVQAELFARLRVLFGLQGMDSVLAEYPEASEGLQEYARVTCEPTLYYAFDGEDNCVCRPDLVIWDDADPHSPPDAIEGNWPALWACEIKYRGHNVGSWDENKLRHLIDQSIVTNGCWLIMSPIRGNSGKGIYWEQDEKCDKIWSCNANPLPVKYSTQHITSQSS